MSEPKWTPGPWSASQTYPPGDWCIHARGIPWQLAYLRGHSEIDWPLEANARLIAAAPELYDELENARAIIAGEAPQYGEAIARIDALLAKARGEP
jgi:hypothetical protein